VSPALVHVIPIFLPNHPAMLGPLCSHLGKTFGSEVVVRLLRFDPESAFDSSRGQYNSTTLLSHLLAESIGTQDRILGVASVDLFIPILTYVFGEAQLEGPAAVVSTYRLNNALYGLPNNDLLLQGRLQKESTHELGHTFGLYHCEDSDCVMHSSTYVEDIDLKSAKFCSLCAAKVRAGRMR
jgi:archaemetzincin